MSNKWTINADERGRTSTYREHRIINRQLSNWNCFRRKFLRSERPPGDKQMTDEHLALQAVSDAQRILEEYLEPRPRNNERIILDRLVEVLERPDLLVAVNRMQRGS
jgi:hypothetical protein